MRTRPRYLRRILPTFALGWVASLAADEPQTLPIPPRPVKLDMPNSTLREVADRVGRQTGLPFTFPDAAAGETCDGIFNGKPYWEALEQIADQTGNRIAVSDGGRKVALVPRGKSREVSSVAGPFRVAARQVVGRYLLDDGLIVHDVNLAVHWEPRFPVFRIDAQPAITKATDDRGTALTPQGSGSKTQPSGAAHAATVHLTGLTREARKIAVLRGHFTVTASEKMLPFRFADLTAKPPVVLAAKDHGGVEAVLREFVKDEDTWVAELELTYPPNLPDFESFEGPAWATENRARLVGSDGKTFLPTSRAVSVVGRTVSATYYFKEDAAKGLMNPVGKGWSLEYDAASPPVEFRVPFELKDIPLP